MRSDAEEPFNVEVAMRVGWILRELAQAKSRPTDSMDVDEKPEVPKTAALAPGSTLQPKRTVDLESMAFSQGGHLMTNKKCKFLSEQKRGMKRYTSLPRNKSQSLKETSLLFPPCWPGRGKLSLSRN